LKTHCVFKELRIYLLNTNQMIVLPRLQILFLSVSV